MNLKFLRSVVKTTVVVIYSNEHVELYLLKPYYLYITYCPFTKTHKLVREHYKPTVRCH